MTEAIPIYLLEKRIGSIYSKRTSVCDFLIIQYPIVFKTIFPEPPPPPLPVLSQRTFPAIDLADRQGCGTLSGSEWAAHASNRTFISILPRSLISSRPATVTALEQNSELRMSNQPKASSISLNPILPRQRVFNKVQFCCPPGNC